MADPITGMEVLSDAVKIGFGGIIAGVAAWLVARQTHKTEIAKLALEHKNSIGKMEFERRTKMLTECAECCDTLFDAALKHSATFLAVKVCKESQIPPISLETITDSRRTLVKALERANQSLSKLSILDEREAFEAFQQAISSIARIQENCSLEVTDEHAQAINANLQILEKAKSLFFVEVRKAFKRYD